MPSTYGYRKASLEHLRVRLKGMKSQTNSGNPHESPKNHMKNHKQSENPKKTYENPRNHIQKHHKH